MTEPPEVDGRAAEDLFRELRERAPHYVPEWDREADDSGAVLYRLFSTLAGDVVERLDQVPEKHRVAFFDALEFSRQPPQPARIPLSVTVADGVDRNVPIPAGTEAVADDLVFEVGPDDGFEATPATLDTVVSVDPGEDLLCDHSADFSSEFDVFSGVNRQEHGLYVGDADLLTLDPGTAVTVTIETAVGGLSGLNWEYYGEEDGVEKWHSMGPVEVQDGTGTVKRTVTVTVPGTPTETSVAETTSRWLRCRIPEGAAPHQFDAVVDGVSLGVPSEGCEPDAMFTNDVPLPVDEGVLAPFGEQPRLRDTFYLSSEEVFSKRGAAVDLTFVPLDPPAQIADTNPTVSWEYWNGSGWSRLRVEDSTADLTRDGTVSFEVPTELAPTTVAGETGHWIRARLVDGDYGQPRYVEETGEWAKSIDDVSPPRFEGVELEYTLEEVEPDHLLAANNGETHKLVLPERPFVPLAEQGQTLYLGFDRSLTDGPVQLFFPVADHEYPEAFAPRMRWEYCADPAGDEWERLGATDGTESLTQRGIVGLVFPEATEASPRFGRTRHWVRVRVTGDEFDRPRGESDRRPADEESGGLEPCEEPLETPPPTSTLLTTPPTLTGIHPNTGWAHNVRTVQGEVLGSSDGSPSQSFTVSTPPVVDETVWVDELGAHSAGERAALTASDRDTETETGPDGDLRAFWVAWDRVDDFLDSPSDARHFTLDRATGRLEFGDGVNGWIPPRGRNTVRIDYRTGGGVEGNISAGSVTDLKSSIPYVDAVINPEAGDGGAAEETMDEVLIRAPRQLRDRDRAVTAADYERIALAASRALARACCLPGLDANGERTPGWVTLLIVPETTARNPVPSVELRQQVESAVAAHAPASVVASDRLVVRGPSAVTASVDARLSLVPGASVSTVEAAAASALNDFLHPLTGGDEGEGWAFGTLPHLSDCYALLEGVDGVDHVADLALTFEGSGKPVRVTEGESNPSVAPDALVRAGTHEIRGER